MSARPRLLTWTHGLLAAAVVIFVVVLGASIHRLFAVEQDVAVDFGENLVLSMAQNEKAALAFLDTLSRYAAGAPEVDHDRLVQRFDLLWSRVSVAREGEMAPRLKNVDGALETMIRTRIVLEEVEPLVETLAPGDAATTREVDERLRPLLPDLARATFTSSHADLARLTERGEVRRQAIMGSIVTMLGIVISVSMLVALLLREIGRHRRLTEVAMAAEAAARVSEQRAVESERLIRGIIDAVPALINVKDRDSRYVFMNAYQGKIYGVAPEDAVGRVSEEFTGHDYGSGSRKLDLDVIRTGRRQKFHEREFVETSGRKRVWWTAKAPLLGADGSVRYVVTVALDITLL
jgi:PAS domain S-box-containing protein